MKILLIEDEEEDAVYFEHQLKSESDIDVQREATLTAGIVRCQSEEFDVAVLDLSLPDGWGLETVDAFFGGVASGPAVVVLTGLDDRELALKAVQAGAQDFIVKGIMKPAALVQTLRHSLERHRMSEQLMAANERVRYLATHCSLTDLPNRYLFLDRLTNAIASASRAQAGLAVLFLDLNRFKPINDTYGHAAGDRVLRCVGERLKATTRSSDTVARLGGDEFVVLLRGLSDPPVMERVAQKIASEIAQPIDLDGPEVVTHPSIGIAIYPADGTAAEALLRNADAAMYSAKQSGESHRFWSESLRAGARQRLDLEADLARAVAEDELELHFQPQVDACSREIVGLEAVVRWERPGHGWVPPSEFIPFAEACGLIEGLGTWVLRRAAETQAEWLARGLTRGRVDVNVSPLQLASGAFVNTLQQVLAEAGLRGEHMTVEVAESCLIDPEAAAVDALEALRAGGVSIAVHEFGTGFSSLGRLAELPLDALKIDRSFVHGVPSKARSAATTRAIIHLGLDLGFDLVAEGVEAAAERDFLVQHGCTRMQGSLYSRPVPAAEIGCLLEVNSFRGESRVNA